MHFGIPSSDMYKYFPHTITLPVIEAKLSIFALLHVHNVCIILDSILVSSTQSALNTQISSTVDCKNYLAITRKHKLRLL